MNKEKHGKQNKSFWKDKKNIAIVILTFLLFCFIVTYPTDSNSKLEELNNQVNSLNSQIEDLNNQIKEKDNQISNFQNENEELKTSKQEPKKEEITKTSSTTTSASKTSQTSNSKTTNDNSEMVWVGETGTKYHNTNCRTLKGKGHQITLQQALSEGKEPCKVCH